MRFVVGTGRCGTTAYAAHHGGVHEPHSDMLVSLGTLYAAGALNDRLTIEILRTRDWPDLSVSYMLTPLAHLLPEAFPGCEVVHLTRDREDVVASMVRMGWYADGEWDLWPVAFVAHIGLGGTLIESAYANPSAWRITAPLVGESSLREWMITGQVSRCVWWVNWCYRRLAGVPSIHISTSLTNG